MDCDIDLAVKTPETWAATVLSDFDAFLADHANCERKASGQAMSMVMKYADRPKILPSLIRIAREELEHFADVYALMAERNVTLSADTKDPYVTALRPRLRHGRDERLLDSLLLAGILEARGGERFALVASAVDEASLREFYERLAIGEERHRRLYVTMARRYFDRATVADRLAELLEAEGRVVRELEIRPALY